MLVQLPRQRHRPCRSAGRQLVRLGRGFFRSGFSLNQEAHGKTDYRTLLSSRETRHAAAASANTRRASEQAEKALFLRRRWEWRLSSIT